VVPSSGLTAAEDFMSSTNYRQAPPAPVCDVGPSIRQRRATVASVNFKHRAVVFSQYTFRGRLLGTEDFTSPCVWSRQSLRAGDITTVSSQPLVKQRRREHFVIISESYPSISSCIITFQRSLLVPLSQLSTPLTNQPPSSPPPRPPHPTATPAQSQSH